MLTDANTKAGGRKIWETAKASSATQMETHITGTSKWVKQMEKESTPGSMAKSTTVSGRLGWNTVMESGEAYTMTVTLVNGMRARRMATAFTHGRMGTVMKVNGTSASSMEQERTYLSMEMHTLVSMLMANLMEKVSTPGQTEPAIWATLEPEWKKERENGAVRKALNVTVMRVTIWTTASMVTASSSGPVETSTKANIKRMSVTAMVKCIGQMVAAIKANGFEVFSMATVKWFSQTARKRKDTSKIMYSRSKYRLVRNNRSKNEWIMWDLNKPKDCRQVQGLMLIWKRITNLQQKGQARKIFNSKIQCLLASYQHRI